jgi:hypothetical protein
VSTSRLAPRLRHDPVPAASSFNEGRPGRLAHQKGAPEPRNTPHLQQDFGNGNKGFGTPTVTSGETIIDTTNPAWLDTLLSQT